MEKAVLGRRGCFICRPGEVPRMVYYSPTLGWSWDADELPGSKVPIDVAQWLDNYWHRGGSARFMDLHVCTVI